jgi:two-component system sensor histidine kinase HydH
VGVKQLLPFVSGFIIAVVLMVGVCVLLCQRFVDRFGAADDTHRRQLEELGKLTGGLAHEIKNPLSTIKVNLKLIGEDVTSTDGDSARWLRKISVVQKETERLEQILEDFLRYIGKSELQLAGVNINELIGEMVDFYLPQAQTSSVTIRQGLAEGPIVCKIDRDMVKQVILNLFINAVGAMPDGGELIIRTAAVKKEAVIEVSDTGCGIGPEKIDKIFDAYYTSRPGGSGLGLPTARKIVEAHGGTITVNSDLGRGTSFTIRLPLQVN